VALLKIKLFHII